MIPLSDLFEVRYGHSLELNRLTLLDEKKGGIPFVSRKMGDNGISAYVAPIPDVEPALAGLLTCALGGNGVMSSFLQEMPFYSGRDIAHLTPKISLTKQQLIFYCTCLVSNRYRFSYGRQANRTLKRILIPSLSELPDYVSHANVDMYIGCDEMINSQQLQINTNSWQSFRYDDIFEIKKGQRLTKADMLKGNIPYVGASDSFNGITTYVGQQAIHQNSTITVSYNGSVAEAFYQPQPYWATDDVNVLYPKNFKLTPSVGLFLCAVIRQEKYRFNYGRKWHLERMKNSIIKLPVKPDGSPDWQFMEQYIQTLPYSSQV